VIVICHDGIWTPNTARQVKTGLAVGIQCRLAEDFGLIIAIDQPHTTFWYDRAAAGCTHLNRIQDLAYRHILARGHLLAWTDERGDACDPAGGEIRSGQGSG